MTAYLIRRPALACYLLVGVSLLVCFVGPMLGERGRRRH